jgi:hypothetical protein
MEFSEAVQVQEAIERSIQAPTAIVAAASAFLEADIAAQLEQFRLQEAIRITKESAAATAAKTTEVEPKEHGEERLRQENSQQDELVRRAEQMSGMPQTFLLLLWRQEQHKCRTIILPPLCLRPLLIHRLHWPRWPRGLIHQGARQYNYNPTTLMTRQSH